MCGNTIRNFLAPELPRSGPAKRHFLLSQVCFPYFRVFLDLSWKVRCLVTSHIQSFSGPCPSEPPQKVSATEPNSIFTSPFFSKWRDRTLFKTYLLVDIGWPPKARDLSPAASGGFGFWKMTPIFLFCLKTAKSYFFMIFSIFSKRRDR